jgi:Family of unknown function (DUF6236)
MSKERGLVISVPVMADQNQFRVFAQLDEQELRFSLLFWDKLDLPQNNLVRTSDPNADFLESVGVLKQTFCPVQLSGIIKPAETYVQAHLAAYRSLDKAEPGVWSLGTGKNSVSFPERELEQGRGILVRLYEAIPVPDKDVPLQDVLEFRAKYRDELLALRFYLEAIYQRILNAGDGELALDSEVEALEKAIVDYLRVAKAVKIPFVNASFEANLNALAGINAGLLTYQTGLGIVASVLAGAAAGFGVGPAVALKGHKATQTPFRYISSFHKRVF